MPYIAKERRDDINAGENPFTVGELNYCITKCIDTYVAEWGANYATINAVIGALECAKLELYRRVAAPYEDLAIARNGDVYACLSD